MTEHNFYRVEELAEQLRLSKMTLYRYIKAGKLQAFKMGKEFRISKKDFKNFLEATKNKMTV